MKENYEKEGLTEKEPQEKGSNEDKNTGPGHPKKKEICLVFIVNGTPFKMDAIIEWHLKKAVEVALKETGNEGRPLTDWTVKWNNQSLALDKKIEEFNFPECVELFLSLNAGTGGC